MSTPPTGAGPGEESGRLLHNIVLFGRLLRGLGLDITPTQILDLVAALDLVQIERKGDVKESARAILVSRPEHQALFNEAFEIFWQERKKDLPKIEMGMILQRPPQPKQEQYQLYRGNTDDAKMIERDDPHIDRIQTFSDLEVLREKDFARMDAFELAEVKRFMQSLRWDLKRRRTRRRQPASQGDQLDLRRTMRRNLRHGGEMFHLAHRRRKQKPRPVVMLCDISGSMDRYARVLIQFLYAITNSFDRVEAFVFSTRLTRITRQLRRRDLDEAVDEATTAVADWAGGTRIGDALHRFNFDWGRRVLGQGAIVLIISDGWDRGDPQALAGEMERLHKSCHRLIWLNPLLGSERYEPLTRGIQAALPHVDDFLPVHNLNSLIQLAELLKG
jgi:uncharacterized protein with von Willebrand factor type A (vWA) domain